jgi:pimeloyl-ACP methyl ester carboxylesterase
MRLTFLLAAAGLALAAPTTAAAPKPAYRAYVDGRWGQIHVRVAEPATGPTVVLIHKMVWSSIEFAKAQPRLAALGIRSIVVDLPGYGLSDGPAAQRSAEDYADDLLPVLNHFKVSRAVMVGANTGATLAAAFALRHPTRTAAVVMDGPPIFTGKVLTDFMAEKELDRTPRPHAGALVERWEEIAKLGGDGVLTDEAIQTGLLQFFHISTATRRSAGIRCARRSIRWPRR